MSLVSATATTHKCAQARAVILIYSSFSWWSAPGLTTISGIHRERHIAVNSILDGTAKWNIFFLVWFVRSHLCSHYIFPSVVLCAHKHIQIHLSQSILFSYYAYLVHVPLEQCTMYIQCYDKRRISILETGEATHPKSTCGSNKWLSVSYILNYLNGFLFSSLHSPRLFLPSLIPLSISHPPSLYLHLFVCIARSTSFIGIRRGVRVFPSCGWILRSFVSFFLLFVLPNVLCAVGNGRRWRRWRAMSDQKTRKLLPHKEYKILCLVRRKFMMFALLISTLPWHMDRHGRLQWFRIWGVGWGGGGGDGRCRRHEMIFIYSLSQLLRIF